MGFLELGTQQKRLAKTWDNDIVLELTKVPSYIGDEIAEMILDIGTMIRFSRKMALDHHIFTLEQA